VWEVAPCRDFRVNVTRVEQDANSMLGCLLVELGEKDDLFQGWGHVLKYSASYPELTKQGKN